MTAPTISAATTSIAIIIAVDISNSYKSKKYTEAIALWESGSKQQAVVIFQDIHRYKDANSYVEEFKENIITQLCESKWSSSYEETVCDRSGRSSVTWKGDYYLTFKTEGQAVFSQYGECTDYREGCSPMRLSYDQTYSIMITEEQISLQVDSKSGRIVMDGDSVQNIFLIITIIDYDDYVDKAYEFSRNA